MVLKMVTIREICQYLYDVAIHKKVVFLSLVMIVKILAFLLGNYLHEILIRILGKFEASAFKEV